MLPSLVRSVKSLAGMAAGRWILHADFVEASASAEALIDPVSTTADCILAVFLLLEASQDTESVGL